VLVLFSFFLPFCAFFMCFSFFIVFSPYFLFGFLLHFLFSLLFHLCSFSFFFWLTSLAYPNLLGTKRLGCCTLSESVYTLGCKPIHFHSLGYVIHQVVCEKGYFGIILQPMTCIHNVFTWVVSCCMHILFQGNVSQREQA
jgi:hypothetical protein